MGVRELDSHEPYLGLMLGRCDKWDGKVFVVEAAGKVVGFACVWARVPVEEPDDDPAEYAYVSDLVVDAAHRHRGLGRELMSAAEDYARLRGARRIRLTVMARNLDARAFYQSMDYSENEIELQKSLEQ